MKATLTILFYVVLATATLGGSVYIMRLFSNATTPVVIVTPKAGITCATMVTSDGAAISCWKD